MREILYNGFEWRYCMIYFDYTASTPVSEEIETSYLTALRENFANPSSVHSAGVASSRKLREARELLAKTLGVSADEIFFTSGGTESNNTALFGAAHALKRRGKHIISSLGEHDSVKAPLRALEKEGFEVTFVTPEANGSTSVEKIRAALRPDTILVSLAAVSNETGAVNDIPSLKRVLSGSNALLHSDCVQLIGKAKHVPVMRAADIISLCSHKLFAPKGSGAIIIRSSAKVEPLILGGGQESGFRSGTENLPAIVAFADAAAKLTADFTATLPKVTALRNRLNGELSRFENVSFISDETCVPHIISLSFVGIPSETLVNFLSREGVCISAGSACKKGRRNETISALGVSDKVAASAVRISLSHLTTEEEIDALIGALTKANNHILRR